MSRLRQSFNNSMLSNSPSSLTKQYNSENEFNSNVKVDPMTNNNNNKRENRNELECDHPSPTNEIKNQECNSNAKIDSLNQNYKTSELECEHPSPTETIVSYPSISTITTNPQDEFYSNELLRVELNLRTTALELRLEKEACQRLEQTVESLNNERVQNDNELMDLYNENQMLSGKLLDVKSINVSLRLKHTEYEKVLVQIKAELKIEKKARQETSTAMKKQRVEDRGRNQLKDEEIAEIKIAMNKSTERMEAMIERQNASDHRMISTFFIGMGVGIVSLLLPSRLNR